MERSDGRVRGTRGLGRIANVCEVQLIDGYRGTKQEDFMIPPNRKYIGQIVHMALALNTLQKPFQMNRPRFAVSLLSSILELEEKCVCARRWVHWVLV
jgi:hypothetical protein